MNTPLHKPAPSSPKIRINLMPPEVIMLEKQASKLSILNQVSIGALVGLVLITSATFGVRLFQNTKVDQTNQQVSQTEQQVTDLKDKEGYAVALKNRLASIQQLITTNQKSNIFSTILNQIPDDTGIGAASIEKNGSMLFTILSNSSSSLDSFVATLIDKQKNGNLISKVDLESMSRGKDGIYRYTIRIYPR